MTNEFGKNKQIEKSDLPNHTEAADVSLSYDLKTISGIVIGGSLLLFLFIVSRYNYLLFHTLAEFFSIAIAWSLFIVVWNSRHLAFNKAFIFIGIAYLFVGSIDLVHTISYKGMGVVSEDWGANPATQLWIAARLIESISLLVFPFLFFKSLHHTKIIAIFSFVIAFVFITIFYWKIFPDCFIEGSGLTTFKKVAEYFICSVLIASWILLHRKRAHLDQTVYKLMVFSILLTIFSELAFTFYVSVYGISNLVGHYFKILSFFLIYLALVKTSLKKPYETLYRELDQSNRKFKSLFEGNISGVALHEIILNRGGDPIDYRFLNLNSAFENLTGLKEEDLIGKTVLEVLPNTERYWIETYGQVALSGNSVQFENYSQELKKHFEVSAYSPKHGQFVTVFNDITNRKQAEEQIKSSLKEKDLLLSEIHHRVKNNMQVVSSLLQLQASKSNDRQVIGILEDSRNRIQSMAMIHDKLYRLEDFTQIDFTKYVQDLSHSLFRAYDVDPGKVTFKSDIEEIPIKLDCAIPCGLIINELVTNSLKHAFPKSGAGEIRVALHAISGDEAMFSVSDNGIGLPKDSDYKNTRSLGLHLVTILAENQLEGEIELDRTGGTKFSIRFKIN